jgi:hypothetical protein
MGQLPRHAEVSHKLCCDPDTTQSTNQSNCRLLCLVVLLTGQHGQSSAPACAHTRLKCFKALPLLTAWRADSCYQPGSVSNDLQGLHSSTEGVAALHRSTTWHPPLPSTTLPHCCERCQSSSKPTAVTLSIPSRFCRNCTVLSSTSFWFDMVAQQQLGVTESWNPTGARGLARTQLGFL